MASNETCMYAAPMERPWPDTRRHVPWYETTSPPPGVPALPPFPTFPVLPVSEPVGMPEQCRARLANLRRERDAIQSRLPVIDAEIETLEKMLAAIGAVP